MIRPLSHSDRPEWLRMRNSLFRGDHTDEVDRILRGEFPKLAVFVAERAGGGLEGFAEVGLRDYAEGCDSSPVGYLEAVWVDEDVRRQGLATQFVARAREWVRGQGCTEFASDALIDNVDSHAFHGALGFQEVERIVCFRIGLDPEGP